MCEANARKQDFFSGVNQRTATMASGILLTKTE